MLRSERWLVGIEFRHLAALEAVAEERSFSRAASLLGYTQSAISQQIAALERAARQKLVERPGGRSQVGLTPAGRTLLRHAEAIGAHLAAARADLAASAEGVEGAIHVGSFPSLGGLLVPEILQAFRELTQDVTVNLSELLTDLKLLVLLEQGDLDVVLAHLPLPPGPFAASHLIADDYVLVVSSDRPTQERRQPTTIKELTELPLIGLRECRCCDPLLAYLGSVDLEISFAHIAESVQTVAGMVRTGFGAAILPRTATDLMGVGIEIIDLDFLDLPACDIAIVSNSHRSLGPAITCFLQAAKTVGSRVQRRRTDPATRTAA